MTITVKFFARLREQTGQDETTIDAEGIGSVDDVWARATDDAERPANLLAAVNMDYASLEQPVRDGDEVAFFPPVTGG